ncbi:ribose-phosphate pyrophosphokinase [Bradyrhizobium sp. WBOS7]|uniref:ribose-phosphate diphosphokinase n=1 Tax=Bradyrhizobium betae TaxID=244734 RepID=A0AAE9SWQ5_9BRAD|nr:ribose-phosphate pyrophosphokinase [Bradyrhizobium sp. WBOS2]MDD1569792.1 ribose-phosphate pyrophosphokinase [Bradyrhizobium sp. WBOS1]MDD1575891.1 ribose-phosphate pyrophosphokinase [Bradyrhizobium sp. WBOS7]MDD1599520.1 ribose-phosphate pyrophosphokinase [Bradyrhizobium sp. WBOS16]UUO39022.1 ribose-phosphate pyrophosphokinase [Bradyrhizobium sp. WBOS01]UUO45208.1 ribose-phosphate pyrophosphokinase [Bradyrhizobium sp. WBOS02]UUO57616.1 ribose-phosphate pyrophosphokinase [Bradyrhizobium sp
MARSDRLSLFALSGSTALGERIATSLGCSLAAHEERSFEDGEHKVRPLDTVAGRDIYVVHSLHGGPVESPNDKLCRLLFLIGALKDAGATSVTAVTPYLCYARKDRRTKENDPVTIRYLASLFEAVGTDRVVTLDVHNEAAYENAFRCPSVALTTALLLIDKIRSIAGDRPISVVSPDLGGGKRADLLREALEKTLQRPIGKAFVEKHRSSGRVSGDLFAGDVTDAFCVVVDDLISSGGTLVRAAKAARAHGARNVIACVAHGLFMPGAETALADPSIDRIIATDTVPPFRLPAGPVLAKLEVISAAPLLAEAIRRLHQNESLADLLMYQA